MRCFSLEWNLCHYMQLGIGMYIAKQERIPQQAGEWTRLGTRRAGMDEAQVKDM